jgi:hypothetical protein
LPARTNTDRINALSEAIAVLTERLDNFAADVAESNSLDQRERLVKLEVKLEHLESRQRDTRTIVIAIIVAIVTTLLSAAITKAVDWVYQTRNAVPRALQGTRI